MKAKNLFLKGIAACSMLFAVAACGSDDAENGAGDGSANKITIFQDKVEISEQFEQLAAEYTEETGVEVEVWGTTGSDYFQQLQVRLNSNQGPSIFSIQQFTELERIHSYVYDMSNESYIQHIADGMALEYEGNIYGVPYGLEGFGLVYNKDLVNPEDFTDLDSFVAALERLDQEGVAPISLANNSFFMIGHLSNYPFSLQEDNYEFIQQLNNGEVTMAETEEFIEFGKFMEAIRDYAPNPLEVSYDQQIGDFATGRTAMIHQGNWAVPMFDDYELDFEIGMMPFPLMGNDSLAVGVASSWAINNDKSDAEIQAANDFLEWMFTSETGHRYIVEEFEFIPALTNIEANDLDPLAQAILDASNNGKVIPWSHIYYPADSVRGVLLPPTEEFFMNHDITGDQLIENLDAAWQR